jgi:hypothetical protein
MRRFVALATVLSWLATTGPSTSCAADPSPADAIAPLLDEQTFAVAVVDLTAPGSVRAAQYLVGLARGASQNGSDAVLDKILSRLGAAEQGSESGAAGHTVYLAATCTDVLGIFTSRTRGLDESFFVVIPGLNKEALEEIRKAFPKPGANEKGWTCEEMHSCTVIADSKLLKRLVSLEATPRPDLTEALAAAGERPVRIAVAPPALFARAAMEVLKSPAPGTERPLGEYLAGLRWACISVAPSGDQPRGELVVQAGNDEGAKRLAELIQGATQELAKVQLASARIERGRATWNLDEHLQKAFGQSMERLAKVEAIHADMNRLKTIGIALHNYHDIHKHFPDVAIRDAGGKPLLSWRVALLPFLDGARGTDLYRQFHLDEPWDSEHNRKLAERMPDAFRSDQTPPGRTRFLAPVGKDLAFADEKGGLSIKTFTDGTSKTIMLAEADIDHAVVWTKPEDLVVDLDNPKRGITDGSEAFLTGFADASAHRFSGDIKPELLRAMLTRNGGEMYNFNDVHPD